MTVPLSTFSGPAGPVITAMQLMVVLTSFSSETNPKTRTGYSKFSKANGDETSSTWPSRVAMMIIYTPAFIASVTLMALGLRSGANLAGRSSTFVPSPSLANGLCAVHMAKRCLEVIFLHRYSGRTDRGTPVTISTFYTLITVLVAYAAGNAKDNLDATTTIVTIGTALFAIGVGGNFYHHYLLSNLRPTVPNDHQEKKYVAPRGGLFSFVATPHYLFELIGWLRIAMVSNHLNVYLVFAGMCSYLGGRSIAQNDFNCQNFDEKEWPRSRKNLVPVLF